MSAPVTFSVPDMTCSHCEATIRKALSQALPDASVAVDLARHQVRIEGDRARAETAIREAGYTPEAMAV
jgi:copper chaperone